MSRARSRRFTSPPWVAALLLLMQAAGAGAQNLYQVELVIFARDSAEAEVEENWQQEQGLAYPKRLIGLAPASEQSDPQQPAAPFQLLPAAERKLNESARAIDRRSNMRELFHGAWVQPVGGIESADPVLITGGRQFGRHSELEGYVVLTSERYLRLRADLWMTRFGTGNALDTDAPVLPMPVVTVQPAASPAATESDATASAGGSAAAPFTSGTSSVGPSGFDYIPDQIYAMSQERRMRSGELHYIDHPRFGLLVIVSPYEPPTPPAPAEPATDAAAPISTAPDSAQ